MPIIRIQNLNNPDARFNLSRRELPEKFLVNPGDLLFAWSGTPGTTSFGAHIFRGGKAWLNQFASLPLNDHQRLALVYLRNNQQITNSYYQRLNHVDSVTANRELRGLVQLGLTEQQNTKRWAYYTLKSGKDVAAALPEPSDEEKILAYVRKVGSISNEECRTLLNVNVQRASYLLRKLQIQGALKREKERRWARYRLV